MTASLNIVVAMKTEAKPLINWFGLAPMSPQIDRFSIYEKEHMTLIVSGIGSINAREAVQCLARHCTNRGVSAWLNVGVAGHGSFDVGQGFLANCITDRKSGQTIHPMFVDDFGLAKGKITTVSEVETDYREQIGYEMEAFGFASSAAKYSTLELIHCYKIVSDNHATSVEQLTLKEIGNLIENHLDAIDRLGSQLTQLANSVARRSIPEDPTIPFEDHWRLTVAQREILRKYLIKTIILGTEIKVDSDTIRNCRETSEMLDSIRNHLGEHWQSC